MASPGLPEDITAGVTTGHVTDHEKIHDLLNEFDSAAQAQATGDLLVFQDGLIKRLPVGSDGQVLTADSGETAGVKWAAGGALGGVLLGSDYDATTISGITSSTFDAGSPVVGVVFTAPESGQVRVVVGGVVRIEVGDNVTRRTELSWELREGGTIGSGTVVQDPQNATAVSAEIGAVAGLTAGLAASRSRLVGNLTPGVTYNVRTMHRVNAGSGSPSGSVVHRSIEVYAV